MEYYLMHYNPYHDPKNGQFTSNTGSAGNVRFGERYLRQEIKGGKDKPNVSRSEKITSSVKSAVDALENARSSAQQRSEKKSKGKSAEGMSDDDLRKTINRIQMERTYESLTKPETKSGYIKAQEILSIVGTTVTIAAAVASIASSNYTMKHPDKPNVDPQYWLPDKKGHLHYYK